MGSVELVVTDLDGTLWAYDQVHRPHAATLEAWNALERDGIHVLVATGRRAISARDGLAETGLAPSAVVLNGALALDLASGEYFHRHHYDRREAAQVLAAFRSHGLDPCIYVEDPEIDAFVTSTPATSPEHIAALGARAVCADLDEIVATTPVLSFGIFGRPRADLEPLAASIGVGSAAMILPDTWSPEFGIAIAPAGVSKWTGVLAYCRRHGIDSSRVLAIGDSVNDIELIASAAIGVAVADAHPDALTVASHIVSPAGVGGWAEILDLV